MNDIEVLNAILQMIDSSTLVAVLLYLNHIERKRSDLLLAYILDHNRHEADNDNVG